MEDFQDYLEKLYTAVIGSTTIDELQAEELRTARNESFVCSNKEPRFTRPNKYIVTL